MWFRIRNFHIVFQCITYLSDNDFRHNVEWAVNGMITEYEEQTGKKYPETGNSLFVNRKTDFIEIWHDADGKNTETHLTGKVSNW